MYICISVYFEIFGRGICFVLAFRTNRTRDDSTAEEVMLSNIKCPDYYIVSTFGLKTLQNISTVSQLQHIYNLGGVRVFNFRVIGVIKLL